MILYFLFFIYNFFFSCLIIIGKITSTMNTSINIITEIILNTIMKIQFMMIKEIIFIMITLHNQIPILMIMIVDPHSTTLNFVECLMRIMRHFIPLIPFIHLLYLKLHPLTLNHFIFILLPVMTKLIILFPSL